MVASFINEKVTLDFRWLLASEFEDIRKLTAGLASIIDLVETSLEGLSNLQILFFDLLVEF